MTKTEAAKIAARACTYEVLPHGTKTHLVIDGEIACGAKVEGPTASTGNWDCMGCARKTPAAKRNASWAALKS